MTWICLACPQGAGPGPTMTVKLMTGERILNPLPPSLPPPASPDLIHMQTLLPVASQQGQKLLCLWPSISSYHYQEIFFPLLWEVPNSFIVRRISTSGSRSSWGRGELKAPALCDLPCSCLVLFRSWSLLPSSTLYSCFLVLYACRVIVFFCNFIHDQAGCSQSLLLLQFAKNETRGVPTLDLQLYSFQSFLQDRVHQ